MLLSHKQQQQQLPKVPQLHVSFCLYVDVIAAVAPPWIQQIQAGIHQILGALHADIVPDLKRVRSYLSCLTYIPDSIQSSS